MSALAPVEFATPLARTSRVERLQLAAGPFELDAETISWLENKLRRSLEPLVVRAKAKSPGCKVRLLATHATGRFVFVHVVAEDHLDGTLVGGITLEHHDAAYRIRCDVTVDDWDGDIEGTEVSTSRELGVSPRPGAIITAVDQLVADLISGWDGALEAFSRRAA